MYNGPIGGRMTDTDDSMEAPIRPDGIGKWVQACMDGQTAPSPPKRMGPMWKNFTLELPIVSVWFVSFDLVWVVVYLCRCISLRLVEE